MDKNKVLECIENHEKHLRDHYAKIGQAIYEHYVAVGNTPEHLVDNYATVAASMAAVSDLKKKLAELKATAAAKTTCPVCNKEILVCSNFCHECGAPVAKKEGFLDKIKDGVHEAEKVYKEAHQEAMAYQEYPR